MLNVHTKMDYSLFKLFREMDNKLDKWINIINEVLNMN